MYFCLCGLKEGFLDGCRPIIGLDGCFLKSIYKGQLLTTVGKDGNDNIYLIAIAYVEIEKYDSWEWFINLLLWDIGSPDEKGWTFISNGKKGLLEAVSSLAPNAEHRFCLRHMYNNFKAKFKGQQLKKLFWKAASTYNVKQHLRIMSEIQRISPKVRALQAAYEWLSEVPTQHWPRCFFPSRTKCDTIVNNLSESFNSYIPEAREQPIIDIFETIRRKCIARIQIKRTGMEKYDSEVCPNICKRIERQRQESRHCFPTWAGQDKYDVMHYMENHIVFLSERHCSCGMFQLVGYPCCHAIAAINYHRLNVDDYVDTYLKKEMYLKVYSHMINLVPGMHDFEQSTLGKVYPPSVKSKIPTPNSRNPFPQSESLFPLDDVPQTSQFMKSTQASQSKTTEVKKTILYSTYNINADANFCATKVCTILFTISDAEYSTAFTKTNPTCSKKEKTTSPNV
ncbi:UNVERIFIED_CONTAM: hypothetical protein Sradi_3777500 [Sesamum radiatum]|uniref:SWIM-type domain-containing protein n=1 Tax=Sesamum radiatum TaxID=300843 RepID=A0AAW2Q022_SESRA